MSQVNEFEMQMRRIVRGCLRGLGRLLLPLLYRIEIQGQENFPQSRPLIIVGNHSAIMEVVLMVVFPPWQVEILGSVDIPHEAFTHIMSQLYGFIPVRRGHLDRAALRGALEALRSGGILGLFPEGGIWQTTERSVQSGVAWLSQRAHTPVLPIFFGGCKGALAAGLKLKRPHLSMHIGQLIPAAQAPPGVATKTYLSEYAWQVMHAVDALRPADEPLPQPRIRDEYFSLEIQVLDSSNLPTPIPETLAISQTETLAKLLHSPPILKIFKVNLRLPVDPLQKLHTLPTASAIATACQTMLAYLKKENPYMLTFRFGPRQAKAMQIGLEELESLARWAEANHYRLHLTPVHQYYDLETELEVRQIKQGQFKGWM